MKRKSRRKKKRRKIKNRFKFNKLILYVSLNIFHFFFM